IAHDDDRRFALGSSESLRGAVTVTALRHHRIHFRQAWENAGDGTLCDVCGPVAIDGTDDFEFRMLLHAFFDAGMNIVIDGNTGKAMDLKARAAIRDSLVKRVVLAYTRRREIVRDAPPKRLGHDAIEGNDRNARAAGFLG